MQLRPEPLRRVSIRLIFLGVAIAALLMWVSPGAQAAIEGPFTYLERDTSTGRYHVTYENAGSALAVSSIDAVTAPAISPDGTKIAFAGAMGNGSLGLYAIYIANVDGSDLIRLTSANYAAELDPSWSPDGNSIIYSLNNTASYLSSSCCRLARTTVGGSTTILTGRIGAVRPTYSPDGSLIAFDTPAGVWTIPSTGGTPLLRAAGGSDPTFSDDGQSIAFLQRSGTSYTVRRSSLATGSSATLHTSSSPLESPVWANGRVFFVEHAGLGYDGRSNVRLRSVPEGGGLATTERAFPGVVAEFHTSQQNSVTAIVGDVDGDGRDDITEVSAGPRTVFRSTGDSFSRQNWGALNPSGGWAQHLGGDFNDDGDDDIASFRPDNGTWHGSISTGSSFATSIWADFSTGTGWVSRRVGDYNGDGNDDVAQFHPSNGTWWVARSNGSSFATELWADFSTASGWTAQLVGDFNNDGRDDLANFHPSNGTWWVSQSTGGGFSTRLWADYSTPSGWGPQLAGDFNGDGRDDIANFHSSNGTWWVSRSTGSGLITELWADFSTSTGWLSRVVGDFNDDGRDDIAQFHPSNGTWWVSRSTGNGFVTELWADFGTPSGWRTQIVGDFNNDGRDDIANYYPGNQTWWVSRSTGSGFVTDLWFFD